LSVTLFTGCASNTIIFGFWFTP